MFVNTFNISFFDWKLQTHDMGSMNLMVWIFHVFLWDTIIKQQARGGHFQLSPDLAKGRIKLFTSIFIGLSVIYEGSLSVYAIHLTSSEELEGKIEIWG